MTARSYSATTLKQKNNENGIVITIKTMDRTEAKISMHPVLSPSAKEKKKKKISHHQFASLLKKKIGKLSRKRYNRTFVTLRREMYV